MSEQPIESLDFHPIAMETCEMCHQFAVARVDLSKGPLFFCKHHLTQYFPVEREGAVITHAAVSL
jgi:hypothetical protein